MKRFALSARLLLSAALLVAGCSNNHSALQPAGPRAAEIADLLLLFSIVTGVVYLVVLGVLAIALIRRRAQASTDERADARSRVFVGAGVGITVVILIGLAVGDFVVGRSLTRPASDPLRIRITGHQYWWEIEYEDPMPSRRLRTANELHIPVGRPVEVTLRSQDVIHSFWVPSLSGKKDLIPGHTNTELLIADTPGVFEGQCAEFCGFQHAKMRLVVHAETAAAFAQWQTRQLEPARTPSSDIERRGQQVFMQSSCILCHSIQGTPAGATVGPDLSHFASRGTLAAGALANTPDNLASWILNPQRIKPGNRMPAHQLPAEELRAMVAYLMSLE
jgi:cytochrome c oxidase subunit 2